MSISSPPISARGFGRLLAAAGRRPFVACFFLGILSNAFGSFFNITYNNKLIIANHLHRPEQHAAWSLLLLLYNLFAYPLCVGLLVYLLWPLSRCLHGLRAGAPVPQPQLERCRRRLVNLPLYVVCLNCLGWLPGALFFPLGIYLLGGWENSAAIWLHFLVSFLVSTLLTTMQTFFLLEAFLVEMVYPEFFQDARPAEYLGTLRIPLPVRLFLYWVAVGAMPVIALLAVALNFSTRQLDQFPALRGLAVGVAVCGILTSGGISLMVGRNLLTWVRAHAQATERVTVGDFEHRIGEKRPDEFGRLTDGFNDMTVALGQARYLRETFGQFVHPDMRDDILEHYRGMGGEVQELTVVFLDIRGFTRRTAGEPPERVVELLNQFFSLAVSAIEARGGLVNKFLGDGLMALFGVRRGQLDHAGQAMHATLDLLCRLEKLNEDLTRRGQAPLTIGAGIHTGPALVGCIGATLSTPDGRQQMRRELTAIGETVNLAQRLEQLTKQCGGPILVSAATRDRLPKCVPLTCVGPQAVPGLDAPVIVFRGPDGSN